MVEDSKYPKVNKFDNQNFEIWKMQIENYIYQKDLYLPLLGPEEKSDDKEDWELLDKKVLSII